MEVDGRQRRAKNTLSLEQMTSCNGWKPATKSVHLSAAHPDAPRRGQHRQRNGAIIRVAMKKSQHHGRRRASSWFEDTQRAFCLLRHRLALPNCSLSLPFSPQVCIMAGASTAEKLNSRASLTAGTVTGWGLPVVRPSSSIPVKTRTAHLGTWCQQTNINGLSAKSPSHDSSYEHSPLRKC